MNDIAVRSVPDMAAQRRVMVDRQIRTYDVTDQDVLSAMLACPREKFLPAALSSLAYSDACLEVGRGGGGEPRRLLAPMILARMIQALGVRRTDACLDVGGGGGYGAALLAELGASVVAIENAEAFSERARAAFADLSLASATAATGPLWTAAGAGGPFDAILVNGAAEVVPDGLLALLSEGGRLAAILKTTSDLTGAAATATVWTKSGGQFGCAPLFTAVAPVLPGFSAPKTFSF